MNVAILGKEHSERAAAAAVVVHRWLSDRDHRVVLDSHTAQAAGLPGGVPRDELAAQAEMAVVLGGDGTLLLAARVFSPDEVPIFGINLGRLGFLTDTDSEHMLEVLEEVFAGDYAIEERMMLSGSVLRGDNVLGPQHAFNDIVVNKAALAQVIRLETHVNGQLVSSYLADGIIFSTPTGSTAYGLAVGGPIVEPSTEVLLVAPICPHMLTNRPLIISGSSTVDCIISEARGEVYLTIDGQEGFPLLPGDRIRVCRSPHRARLVQAASRNFFEILRAKMGWG
ncbi:MAG: NAD(+)/NADH kinase [Myxococcota bacterium]|nr:NAD(+)/NADH kinase [Myxococcota bacterium]